MTALCESEGQSVMAVFHQGHLLHPLAFFFLFICLSLQCLNIIRQTKEHIYVKWLILIGEQWIDLTTKYCVHSQTLIELITVSKNKIPTMSHNVALNDTVLHYDAHGHCSLFYKPVPHIPVCCKYLIESQICINTWLKIATNRCSNVSFQWSAVLVNNLVHFLIIQNVETIFIHVLL